MFEQMVRRVEAGAGEAVRVRVAAVAGAFRDAGVMVTEEGSVVTARARGLVRRWLDDAALRSMGLLR